MSFIAIWGKEGEDVWIRLCLHNTNINSWKLYQEKLGFIDQHENIFPVGGRFMFLQASRNKSISVKFWWQERTARCHVVK